MGRPKKSRRITVSISINKDVDDLFRQIANKVIQVNDKKLIFSRTRNDIYNKAIEYAIEHINEWA